jgi:hypothetical protein
MCVLSRRYWKGARTSTAPVRAAGARFIRVRGVDCFLGFPLLTRGTTACFVRSNEAVIAALLTAPTLRVDAKNDDGNTPLHYWCRTYKVLALFALWSSAADVLVGARQAESPLALPADQFG